MRTIISWMMNHPNAKKQKIIILLLGIVLLGNTVDGQTPPADGTGAVSPGKFHSSNMGWILLPEKGWQQAGLLHDESTRRYYLGGFCESIEVPGDVTLQKPLYQESLYGLRILNYYAAGSKEKDAWQLVNGKGEVELAFWVFYSADQRASRQLALDRFLDVVRRPHERSSRYRYQEYEQETRMILKTKGQYPFYAEKGNYALYINPSSSSMTAEQTRQLVQAVLDALTGNREFSYYPQRAKIFEQRSKLSLVEKERLFNELGNKNKGMSSSADSALYEYELEMVKALGVESVTKKFVHLNDKTFPNVNRGVGTIPWIRKHLDVPFTPTPGNLDQHVDGITGVFLVKKGAREYPVDYMIAHLPCKNFAMDALFSMQAGKAVHSETKEEDIRKVAAMTQVHPGLVGDYDLCLKPVINGLGVPVPGSEHAWICFVRGNTAVMLKSMDLKVSVLPLAKILDEALKKGIEAYEKPEFVR